MSWQPENKPQLPPYRPYTSPQWSNPYGQQPPSGGTIKWPGIISLSVGIVCGVALAITLLVATLMVLEHGDNVELYPPEVMPAMVITSCFMFLALLGTVVGVVFGIVGLAMKNASRVLSVIGLLINAILLIGVVLLVVLGALV